MRVLITGATGFFGGNLLRVLHAAGASVRYTARGQKTAIAAQGLSRVERVSCDIDDVEAMRAACRGADWVVHAAALVSMAERDRTEMERVNVRGTEVALDAARVAGVRRFVHVSTVDTVGFVRSGAPATEATAYNFDALENPYPDTKKAAEARVLAACKDGLDAVIVNPGFMIGAFDPKPSSGRLVLEVLKGRGLLAPSGGNSFADVLDVCHGTLFAAEKGRTGERYILAGHNLRYRELFAAVARTAGAFAPVATVPTPIAWAFAAASEALARVTKRPPFVTRGDVAFAPLPHYFSSAKAERELGYRISAIEPAIARAAEWFRRNGYV